MNEAHIWLRQCQTRDELVTVYRVIASLSQMMPAEFSTKWERAFRRRAEELGLTWKGKR